MSLDISALGRGAAAHTSATGASASANTSATGTAGMTFDKDMFLKLLVAQLKYQDPGSPVDNSQFMAQTAQFSTVEQLTALNTVQQDMLAAQIMLGAANLVGRTVIYEDASGKNVTGVVGSVTFSGSNPTLRIGNTDVLLSSVREVKSTAG